ncbi:hypothetical protein RintRC_1541 [Richelia intracellularis]|nr:hypothetical protein RintRC_1541 [Richelia intracellularis]
MRSLLINPGLAKLALTKSLTKGSSKDNPGLLNQGMISLNFQRFINGFKP